MSPKELTAFRLEPDLLDALRLLKERDGVGLAEQVRRALSDWVHRHDGDVAATNAAFDLFEASVCGASNGSTLDAYRLPKGFGPRLSGRLLWTLTPADMDNFDRLAKVLRRRQKSHRDFWQNAIKRQREKAIHMDHHLSTMTDDDIREALFRRLRDRFDTETHRDPALQVHANDERAFSVVRNGFTGEFNNGLDQRLLRGQIIWPREVVRDRPEKFSVFRTADRKRLAVAPSGDEGGVTDIVERLVSTFLDHAR